MEGINFSKVLKIADRICDYVPLVSTANNLVDIVQKAFNLRNMDPDKINESAYYSHLKNKSWLRCVVGLVPVVGNGSIIIKDVCGAVKNMGQRKTSSSTGDEVSTTDQENSNSDLEESSANQKNKEAQSEKASNAKGTTTSKDGKATSKEKTTNKKATATDSDTETDLEELETETQRIEREANENNIGAKIDAISLTPARNLGKDRVAYNAYVGALGELQNYVNAIKVSTDCPFGFREMQEPGGQCGRHVINNAFGHIVFDETAFNDAAVIATREQYAESFGGDKGVWGADKDKSFDGALDIDNMDFGYDPEGGVDYPVLARILESNPNTKCHLKEPKKIKDLPGYDENKSRAISDYIEDADWIIVTHTNTTAQPLPHGSFETGHFVAARKDKDSGEWWLIDSIADKEPYSIPLTIFHKSCTILVPTTE